MAEIKINLGPMMRAAFIEALVEMIPANLTEAVVIGLLRRDAVTRCILADELGEQALKEKAADDAAQAIYDANKGNGCHPPEEKTWDAIMTEVLDRMADTPGGRGEVA